MTDELSPTFRRLTGLAARLCLTTAVLGLYWVCSGAQTPAPAESAPAVRYRLQADDYHRIDAAVSAAARFLQGRIELEGKCKDEFPADNPRFGGATAVSLYAMLAAGLDARDESVQRAAAWLMRAKLNGTYAVAMRAAAFSLLKDDQSAKTLAQDAAWLVKAAAADGSYTYTSMDGHAATDYDNSNAQMAAMAIWCAQRRGVEVPQDYWERTYRHWTSQQQGDGGFGYFIPRSASQAKTYGSMTAAGLATLYICNDALRRDEFVRCAAPADTREIDAALAWLDKNYRADENPRLGANWYHYWLFSLERVAMAGGRRYIGGHDWFADGAAELLRTQNPDGSWGAALDRTPQTAFAAVFLARGRHPVALGKLAYKGKWNARPRDAANFADWLGRVFERPLNWQVVDVDSPAEDWQDAPILYISGAAPVEFTDRQADRLRTFVRRGGMIVSEAACNNAPFTMDMQLLLKRLLAPYELKQLPPDHPVYGAHFNPRDASGLWGASNGIRMLAVHASRELSLALQLPNDAASAPTIELAANIYQFATDAEPPAPRGLVQWPVMPDFVPRAAIRLARIKHAGNCNPEPLALERLAAIMARRHRIKLEFSEPLDPKRIDVATWPLALIVGTEDVKLPDDDLVAIREYLAAGGRLCAEAAGGSKAFAGVIEKQIVPLVPRGRYNQIAPSADLYAWPEDARKVAYRREYAATLDDQQRRLPQLRSVLGPDDKPWIIVSREDITGGLVGCPVYKLRGYNPESAVQLMTNVLCHLGGAAGALAPSDAPASTSEPASMP